MMAKEAKDYQESYWATQPDVGGILQQKTIENVHRCSIVLTMVQQTGFLSATPTTE